MSLCLTAADLHDLTGYSSARGQREWLRARNWRFEVARDGSPRVARAYFMIRMGAANQEAATTAPVTEPDWTAIG